jgi:hypothetical protein
MTRTRHITIGILALAVLALGAPAAHADYRAVIRDCADDGYLQGTYTKRDLKGARSHLPSDLREYSDCSDVITRALASLANKGRNGRAGGDYPPAAGDPNLTTPSGAIASNPQQFDALKERTKGNTPAPKVTVAGRPVTPGTGGLVNTAARTAPNELPGPLLVALIALAAMGVLAGILVLRRRWPETRRVALRILRR